MAAVAVQLLPGTQTSMSSSSGAYSFTSLTTQTWTIEPFMEPDASECVTNGDAMLALDAAIEKTELNEQERLAADVSGDGRVTAYDAALMLRYSAGMTPSLPAADLCGTNWLFIPDAADMPNQASVMPHVTESSCAPGAIQLTSLVGPAVERNFRAVLIGDVDGSWIAPH